VSIIYEGGDPLGLSMYVSPEHLDEEKSKHISLAQQKNAFFKNTCGGSEKGIANLNTCWVVGWLQHSLIGLGGLLLVVSHLFAVIISF
jgi:hypothetical protein